MKFIEVTNVETGALQRIPDNSYFWIIQNAKTHSRLCTYEGPAPRPGTLFKAWGGFSGIVKLLDSDWVIHIDPTPNQVISFHKWV